MFQIDAQKMMDILRQSYAGLNMNKERLNGLNVFPVPDGDTGTNMSLTLKAAYKSLNAHTFNRVDELLKSFLVAHLWEPEAIVVSFYLRFWRTGKRYGRQDHSYGARLL